MVPSGAANLMIQASKSLLKFRRSGLLAAAALVVALAAGIAGRERLRQWQLSGWSVERLRAESDQHPEDGELQAELVRRLLERGRAAEAVPVARGAVRAAPESAHAWLAYARASIAAGDAAEGRTALRKVLELAPKSVDAYLEEGQLFLREHSSHAAIDQFRQCTRLAPKDVRGWLALARAFQDVGEPGNARDALRRARELRPDDADVLAALGETDRQAGDLAGAERELRRALELRPAQPAAMTSLARLLLARSSEPGTLAEAEKLLRRATELEPGLIDARYELGQALLQKGDAEGAVREWEQVLAASPEDARCRHALALACARLGRKADAERHRAAFERADAYRQRLEAVIHRAGGVDRPADLQFERARVHLAFGKRRQASEALRTGLAQDPSNSWARKTLAGLQSAP
jgi:cytochrome c-type biogenesis protein CcmH/NrfG